MSRLRPWRGPQRQRDIAEQHLRGMRDALAGRLPDCGRQYHAEYRHLDEAYAAGYAEGAEMLRRRPSSTCP